jgi:hypothetical protein
MLLGSWSVILDDAMNRDPLKEVNRENIMEVCNCSRPATKILVTILMPGNGRRSDYN